jgi:triosephosphate isomerase
VKFVLGGNWKLQINTIEDTITTLRDMTSKFGTQQIDGVEIFLALPFTLLSLAKEELKGSTIQLAAQNVASAEKGAYTGEVSVESLVELDVEYVLVGHSERRIIFGEKGPELNKKMKLLLEHNLKPVYCVGETAQQRQSGLFDEVISQQLAEGFEGITEDALSEIIIAYEPVWAINNPELNPGIEIQAATPEQAIDAHKFIRSWFVTNYSDDAASHLIIQYGGSMKPSNAETLLSQSDINGGLIGGASLNSETLGPIVEIASKLV